MIICLYTKFDTTECLNICACVKNNTNECPTQYLWQIYSNIGHTLYHCKQARKAQNYRRPTLQCLYKCRFLFSMFWTCFTKSFYWSLFPKHQWPILRLKDQHCFLFTRGPLMSWKWIRALLKYYTHSFSHAGKLSQLKRSLLFQP